MLVDRHILVERGGEWVLDEPAGFPVPDSVLGIIAARLDAVPATDKTVIQDAAVVGKVFWPGAVAHIGDPRQMGDRGGATTARASPARPPQARDVDGG